MGGAWFNLQILSCVHVIGCKKKCVLSVCRVRNSFFGKYELVLNPGNWINNSFTVSFPCFFTCDRVFYNIDH